jgi:acetyl esterase/lipase
MTEESAPEDVIWAKPGGLDLQARLYRPPRADRPAPVLIDVHGGAWASGDRTHGALYAAALAREGLLVVSIDFRQGPDFKHPAGSADVAAAVRWARLNAGPLNADPARIGLVGSSSGGHLAMLAGVEPSAPAHRGTPILDAHGETGAHDEIDAGVSYVIAMWPVSDPGARYRYAKRAGLAPLQRGTEAYFADEAAQWEASIPRIVTAGEAERLPPLFVIQPGEDSNIPQDMTFDLIRAYQARGGKIEYAFYPGARHAFGHRPSAASADLIRALGDFIRRRNEPA